MAGVAARRKMAGVACVLDTRKLATRKMARVACVLFGLNAAVAFTQPLGMHASIQQDGHVLDLLGKREKIMSDMRELDKHIWQRSPVPRDQHALIFAEEKYEEIINVRHKKYVVRDFTKGMQLPSVWWNFRRKMSSIFGQPGPIDIGRYNEMRGNMYSALMESKPVCDDGSAAWGGLRNIHIGLDIGAAVGTPVRSFADGKVYCFGYNAGAGDYGHTLVMEHEFRGVKVWALYGHLSGRSMERKFVGQQATRGQIIAYIGLYISNPMLTIYN